MRRHLSGAGVPTWPSRLVHLNHPGGAHKFPNTIFRRNRDHSALAEGPGRRRVGITGRTATVLADGELVMSTAYRTAQNCDHRPPQTQTQLPDDRCCMISDGAEDEGAEQLDNFIHRRRYDRPTGHRALVFAAAGLPAISARSRRRLRYATTSAAGDRSFEHRRRALLTLDGKPATSAPPAAIFFPPFRRTAPQFRAGDLEPGPSELCPELRALR